MPPDVSPEYHSMQRSCRFLLILALLAPAGCGGDGRVAVYPVKGRVLFRGAPAVGALVVMHPNVPRDERRELPICRGTVDENGDFTISSYGDGDGAPAGDYTVTVAWPQTGGDSDDPESSTLTEDRFGGKYSDPENSGLKAVVSKEATQLKVFDLQ